MSLWKIPLILLESVSTHRITSSPNPTADRARGGVVASLIRSCAAAARLHRWLVSITEIILILACNSRSFSHIITSCIPRSEKAIAIASNLHVSPAFILGCSLVWFGAYIRTTSYRKLGEQFTFTIGIAKNHRLVTTGIYSVVRHPAYAGLMIGPAGSTLSYFSSGSLWNVYHDAPVSLRSLALLWWTMVFVAFPMCILLRVPQEERMMKKAFPEEWETYTKRTPYRLIPYIY